ncbi:MAG: zinc ribbon domain-containing protein [Pseudonocardia sp.]|nr:zinc ribbon domain-containing protein [Pseudonocardia sp.]
MTLYQYRCDGDGVADVALPIGTAPSDWPCPRCGNSMARVFTAPMLNLASRPLTTAIARAERSRDQPDVVSAPPPRDRGSRTPTAVNPLLARLPRP